MMSAHAHQRDHGSVLKLHAAMDGIGIVLDYYSFLAVWTTLVTRFCLLRMKGGLKKREWSMGPALAFCMFGGWIRMSRKNKRSREDCNGISI